MRILGVSELWPKLQDPRFTTFRFARRDNDWRIGEVVQVVYHPRGKDRQFLGVATIINKELRTLHTDSPFSVSDVEAHIDGFIDRLDMYSWMIKTYGRQNVFEPMNRLTLEWAVREQGVTR